MSMTEERTVLKPHLAATKSAAAGAQLSERVRSLRLPQPAAAGRSSGRVLAWALCLLFAGTTAVLAYLRLTDPVSPPPTAPVAAKTDSSGDPASAPAAAMASSGQFALEAKGYIIPAHQILVSPKVNGMVVKLRIIESQRVTKNEILAELENTEFRADRDRAIASLAQAKARLGRCLLDYTRAKELLPKNAISQSDFDLIVGTHDEAVATVKLAEAELAKAQWQLDNCTIRAPVSGTILKKNAEEGSLVNPIAMQGFYSLCEMADLSDLEVDLTIQERDVSRIFKDQKCTVRAEAFPDRVYEGVVSRLMPIADRGKGAIPVRVKVTVPREEEGVYLKPEMSAIVSFLADKGTGGKAK
jgi:HlyD family secretion protein